MRVTAPASLCALLAVIPASLALGDPPPVQGSRKIVSDVASGRQGLPSPPGKLVDIGGRRLHVNCMGRGSPVVILEAGSGAFSIDWALVQPRVAHFTRVCAYDRAGYAWSDPGPADDHVDQVVEDLHRLLANVDVRKPVVLVGQSIGGIFARAFQRRYQSDVAALILIDSTHEDGVTTEVGGRRLPLRLLTAEQLKAAETPHAPPSTLAMPTKIEEPYDRLPPNLQRTRLLLTKAYLQRGQIAQAQGDSSLESWREEFAALYDIDARDPHPLGNLPLIVISRGLHADFPEKKRQQLDLARLSANSCFIVATKSEHEVQLYQPDLVTEAISRAVGTLRSGSRILPCPQLTSTRPRSITREAGEP